MGHVLVNVISNSHRKGPVLVHGILCQSLVEPLYWCMLSPTATVITLFWCMVSFVSHCMGHVLVHFISNSHRKGPVKVHGILCQPIAGNLFWCMLPLLYASVGTSDLVHILLCQPLVGPLIWCMFSSVSLWWGL